jgi:AcrR family transcriptional regulator
MSSNGARSPQSDATRARIVAAAEQLFAERGFAGTTMRDLTTAAGTNLAAVNYHFGSKEGLLETVFRTYLEPISAERMRLLDEAESRAQGEPIPLRTLIELYIGPAVRSLTRDRAGIPSLVSRLHQEPHPTVEQLILNLSQPVIARYAAAVQRTLPQLDAQRILIRGHLMTGAMLYILGHGRLLMSKQAPASGTAAGEALLIQELINFCAAGLRQDA